MSGMFEALRKHRRWVDPLLVAIVMFPVVQLMSAVAESPNAQVDVCKWQGNIPVEVLQQTVTPQCDLTGRVVYSGNVAITVPPKGVTVAAAGAKMAGPSAPQDLVLTNQKNGEVQVTFEEAPAPSARAATTKASRCSDASMNVGQNAAWKQPLAWRVNESTIPRHMQKAAAVNAIKAAANNVATGANSCGQSSGVAAPQSYAGATTAHPDISVVGNQVTCGDYNADNTVAFTNLPNGLYGWTCYWWISDSNEMVAADMVLTTNKSMVTKLPKPAKCWNKWDLATIAAHEWGHAFGLSHVSARSKFLTMPPYLVACTNAQSKLGLGDLKGMQTLYAS